MSEPRKEYHQHVPVLLEEILTAAKSMPNPPKKYLDGTFGRGGHARAMLQVFPQMQVYALDQDPQALQFAEQNWSAEIQSGNARFFHQNFSDFDPEKEVQDQAGHSCRLGTFDLILVDLGVSSPQLDDPARGFSFYGDGPLDMRMNSKSEETTAAQIVNTWEEEDLVELFQQLGEIAKPHRVVRAIVNDRKQKPFETTRDLAGLIERVEGWRTKGRHPATNYFLALRLKVNRELECVEVGIPKLMAGLNLGGRLLVLTFHSLEDRIVKNLFRDSPLGKPVNKKVIKPSWNEQKINPRARSAQLRVFERHDVERPGTERWDA